MIEELFKVPVTKSPRLLWIEKHRVKTRQTPAWEEGLEDEDGNDLEKWYASDDDWRHGYGGDTEDNALAAWAEARGKLLWFEEGLS